jgi:DNA-binding GntR family transcriptional regulator
VLRDKIVGVVREWILTGVLKPGERVVESTLASRLGVSRAPFREALWLLAHDGLVRLEPNKGAYVTHLDEDEIRDFFELREVLETHAAKKIRARLTPEKERRLRAALAALEEAARRRDMRAFVEADHAFHRTIWRLCDNRHVEEVLGGVSARYFSYGLVRDLPHAGEYRFRPLVREHAEMVRLIVAGSPAEIEAGFRRLFAGFLEYLLERFRRQT